MKPKLTGITSTVTITSYGKNGNVIPPKPRPKAKPFASKDEAILEMQKMIKKMLSKRNQLCVFWGSKRRDGSVNKYRPHILPGWIEEKLDEFQRRLEASDFDLMPSQGEINNE